MRLDVYTPRSAATASRRPVIVFFYGGSWQRGDKNDYQFVASLLTRLGFTVVIPNYRLFPEVVFPEFMHDAAAAVDWSQRHAEQFGADPGQLFVMGHSAGAHIAALLQYDANYLANLEQPVAGLIGLSGPYDFLPLSSETLARVFPESVRADSQPINFAHGNAAPALLLHGGKDQTVGPGNSIRLARRIKAAGGVAETGIYNKRGHAGVLLALAQPLRWLAPVVADIRDFVMSS